MKIIGLPYFQQAALRAFLSARDVSGDCELQFEDSISLRRLDSLWYGGGMVNIKYKGYTYHIEAVGDVYASLYSMPDEIRLCYVKDKNNNGNFGSEMISFFKSDRTLDAALGSNHRRYQIEIEHNNWWECFVTDPNGVFRDMMMNLDNDRLFGAIAEVLGSLDEIINYVDE